MVIEKSEPWSSLVGRIRCEIGMTTTEAAQLVFVTRRSWESWESGSSEIPRARLELLINKVKGGYRSDHPSLVVVIGPDQRPLDVISSDNFLNLIPKPDGFVEIRSLAIDWRTKRPYVHKTVFKIEPDNEHVIRFSERWKGCLLGEPVLDQ